MSKAHKIEVDPDNPIWTKRDFERALPVAGLSLREVAQALRNARGPQKVAKKMAISIRLKPEIVAHFKKGGAGWQKRMEAVLAKAVGEKIPEKFEPFLLKSQSSPPNVNANNYRGNNMARDSYYIERDSGGEYKVLKPNAGRASAVESTQAKAIERAKQMNPDAAIHVERVREVGPGRDKWRKL